MPYRNINIDEEDLKFIKNNTHLTGVKLQKFVDTAIKNHIEEIKAAAEFIRIRREKQAQELSKKSICF